MMNKEFKKYTIKKGDTLSAISDRFYGSPNFVDKIMSYNNFLDQDSIFPNQQIELPGIDQLEESSIILPNTTIPVPNGIIEINQTFGNLKNYISNSGELSPRWNLDNLITIRLPFAIKSSWDFKKNVTQLTCHKKLASVFYAVFEEIEDANLKSEIKSFGGAFTFRTKRKSNNFSTHSWGIAIDLNPLSNGMGTKGDMSPAVVTIFRKHGFKWGGDWIGKGCDPMHFQYCTGY
jgi:hypothetical protein